MKHESTKRRAEKVINENITAFRQKVDATIEYELIMLTRETRDGNMAAAERHKLMAEIYQSILDRI